MTKKQIIIKLYKDKFIGDRVLWNILGSKFKKYEIEEIDKTFKEYSNKGSLKESKYNCKK